MKLLQPAKPQLEQQHLVCMWTPWGRTCSAFLVYYAIYGHRSARVHHPVISRHPLPSPSCDSSASLERQYCSHAIFEWWPALLISDHMFCSCQLGNAVLQAAESMFAGRGSAGQIFRLQGEGVPQQKRSSWLCGLPCLALCHTWHPFKACTQLHTTTLPQLVELLQLPSSSWPAAPQHISVCTSSSLATAAQATYVK
jgi:hypothetical protein